jgi:hypothetical protein
VQPVPIPADLTDPWQTQPATGNVLVENLKWANGCCGIDYSLLQKRIKSASGKAFVNLILLHITCTNYFF